MRVKLAGLTALCIFSSLVAAWTPARAWADGEPATLSSIKIEEPDTHTTSACDQFFTLSFGALTPESIVLSNGTYQFDYGSRPTVFQAQASWALKVADLGTVGGLYMQGGIGFSAFGGNATQAAGSNLTTGSYGLGLLGLDGRLMYSGAWFPWKPLVPFVDGGYRYSVYYQPGASGLESVEGGVGNPVASLGLRLWLNRTASLKGSTPLFVTLRAERIFPRQNSVNLASTSLLGGLTLGL